MGKVTLNQAPLAALLLVVDPNHHHHDPDHQERDALFVPSMHTSTIVCSALSPWSKTGAFFYPRFCRHEIIIIFKFSNFNYKYVSLSTLIVQQKDNDDNDVAIEVSRELERHSMLPPKDRLPSAAVFIIQVKDDDVDDDLNNHHVRNLTYRPSYVPRYRRGHRYY